MSWHDLEMLARGGTLSLLGLWSWLLWRDHRDMLAARVAIAMNLGIACYVIVAGGWVEKQDLLSLLVTLGARLTPALFWLFARTWFNDRTRLSQTDLLIVAAAMVNVLIIHFALEGRSLLFFVSGATFRIAMFAFGFIGLWEAWRGREGDLVEGRRRLRLALIGTVGLYVLVIAVAEMAVYQANAPASIISLIGSSIVFITLPFCAAMFAMRQSDLFGTRPALISSPPTRIPAADPLAERLLACMATERPYRDEGLTIAMLAQRLGEQEYRLRRLINGVLGHRNFAQFLNSYRLGEVRQALNDPAQREVPILTIALDAGFGSLGPFNRAFRDAEAMTPSSYRARALADSGIG